MNYRPIIFSGPMVRALLDGSKTQTRRIVKQAAPTEADGCPWVDIDGLHTFAWTTNGDEQDILPNKQQFTCPYGQPRDRLWVRENFQPFLNDDCDGDMHLANWKTGENYHCTYPATDGIHEFMDADNNLRSSVKPSIHMPRWASRITLEITGVRVERLQDISREDAVAEGIEPAGEFFGCPCWRVYGNDEGEVVAPDDPIGSYQSLWESINGPGSWDADPWVWVVEFKRVPA